MMVDEKGYIQFECEWNRADRIEYERLPELTRWRRLLWDERLVGVDANGVGYGNLSERIGDTDKFVITSTQTGRIRNLDDTHFAIVTESDVPGNRIACTGAIKASSEALSHAILYHADRRIGAVVHVHNAESWLRLRDRVPTTDSAAEAGTVAMANEIRRVVESNEPVEPTVIVMGGHHDGLLSFGRNIAEACAIMLTACGRSIPHELTSMPTPDLL